MNPTADYELKDRFIVSGRPVFLNGVDALVRLPLEQAKRDAASELSTAGFISGYRGSPLGTYDMALSRASELLASRNVTFQPGLNEDLAATAVWGSQQSSLLPDPRVSGVFALWYGKGPGVDRSVDALKHGNFAGTSQNGGVLVVAGDDPGAKSSSLAHQSEPALIHCAIPVLDPSTPEEIIKFGLVGWAMSRFAGCWVGLHVVTDLIESGATTIVSDPGDFPLLTPDVAGRAPGRHIAWNRPALELEDLAMGERLSAAQEFVRVNRLDGVTMGDVGSPFGIVGSGKAYLDLRQALDILGIDDRTARGIGLSVYKVGMTWPVEPLTFSAFARGKRDLLVVEEKRPTVEDQIARILYSKSDRPRLIGKHRSDGSELFKSVGELSPHTIAVAIAEWLGLQPPEQMRSGARLIPIPVGENLHRKPAFCAGCPHNASTNLPEESIGLGGIGCHGMATYMPERRTLAYTHMGGEGANWIGMAPFSGTDHIFQNMGDGTYFHSGLLAIRAAVAAGVNITYKILANGAVAMTGGQEIEGHSINAIPLVQDISGQLLAEGVAPVVVVSDKPQTYKRRTLPRGVRVVHRDELTAIQEEFKGLRGVTALVYDQTCAAEARRLRKKGQFPDPQARVVINEQVCEGCGDCSVQSNCIAIEPSETEFGRKRTINQAACNKDYSCVKGYCPSFAIVKGGTLRKPRHRTPPDELLSSLPEPEIQSQREVCNILIGGIGGTGVVTVGAILAMAAHLEGRAVTTLDVTGLAQKNGSVSSHIRIGHSQADLHSRRIPTGMADLVIGCDLVVTAEDKSLATMQKGRTIVLVNSNVVPTADFALNPSLDLSSARFIRLLERTVGAQSVKSITARDFARDLIGDDVGTNLFLLGFALQTGSLPVAVDSIEKAIELNGVAVAMNKAALRWGRIAAWDIETLRNSTVTIGPTSLGQDPLQARLKLLQLYQDDAYAESYREFVEKVTAAEATVTAERRLTDAVTRSLFKLMSYKDEYEVARLYTDGAFHQQIEAIFENEPRVEVQLAPQRFVPLDPRTGRPRKISFGPWIFLAFRVLSRMKRLRGTRADVFGHTAHRRRERALIGCYREDIEWALAQLDHPTYEKVVELAEVPQGILGFGDIKESAMDAADVRTRKIKAEIKLIASGATVQEMLPL